MKDKMYVEGGKFNNEAELMLKIDDGGAMRT